MKIVQVTTSSTGGAGIAALRLHKALRQAGIRSAYVSTDKTLDFNNLEIEDTFFKYRKPSYFKRVKQKLQSVLFPSRERRFRNKLAALDSQMKYEILNLPFSQYSLAHHPFIQEAEIINFHWVGKLLDYERFFSEVKKPIVWTLHDMNPFIGIFHYMGDQENNALVKHLDDSIFQIKREALKKVSKGAIISPSNWLLQLALKSGVFNHFGQQLCIPNAIDLNVFDAVNNKSLCESLGITESDNVLLFTSGRLDIFRKGLDLMLEAIELLTIQVTLLILGKGSVETSKEAIKMIPLGFVSEPKELAAYYNVADAFVLPSREDNLPNTMLESLATGTPVISFATGGMKEYITNGFNGILADEISAPSLAEAIELFFNNKRTFDRQQIRIFAEDNFSLEQQAEGYIKVYRNLLS